LVFLLIDGLQLTKQTGQYLGVLERLNLMENPLETDFEPIAAVILRNAQAVCNREFETWAEKVDQFAQKFDGFLGAAIIPRRNGSHNKYGILVRYAGCDQLRSFIDSLEFEEYLKDSDLLMVGEISEQEIQKFEPDPVLYDPSISIIRPAKYKVALLTFIMLYPMLLGVSTLIAMIFKGFSRPLLVFFTLLIMVPLMTYVIMPWVTKLARLWQ
jgi:antibiotic biosynthesis monooxygenase (ABM) superfamily enzyme